MGIQLFILLMLGLNNCVEVLVTLTLSFKMLTMCVLPHFFHDLSSVKFINFIDFFLMEHFLLLLVFSTLCSFASLISTLIFATSMGLLLDSFRF